ncbi:hypothetical protein LTR66_017244 [Elasticomyces elasticus]|nr:hypothetical protein LTR66_017244 [Elasticomyces elasticus]
MADALEVAKQAYRDAMRHDQELDPKHMALEARRALQAQKGILHTELSKLITDDDYLKNVLDTMRMWAFVSISYLLAEVNRLRKWLQKKDIFDISQAQVSHLRQEAMIVMEDIVLELRSALMLSPVFLDESVKDFDEVETRKGDKWWRDFSILHQAGKVEDDELLKLSYEVVKAFYDRDNFTSQSLLPFIMHFVEDAEAWNRFQPHPLLRCLQMMQAVSQVFGFVETLHDILRVTSPGLHTKPKCDREGCGYHGFMKKVQVGRFWRLDSSIIWQPYLDNDASKEGKVDYPAYYCNRQAVWEDLATRFERYFKQESIGVNPDQDPAGELLAFIKQCLKTSKSTASINVLTTFIETQTTEAEDPGESFHNTTTLATEETQENTQSSAVDREEASGLGVLKEQRAVQLDIPARTNKQPKQPTKSTVLKYKKWLDGETEESSASTPSPPARIYEFTEWVHLTEVWRPMFPIEHADHLISYIS